MITRDELDKIPALVGDLEHCTTIVKAINVCRTVLKWKADKTLSAQTQFVLDRILCGIGPDKQNTLHGAK